MHTAIVFEYAQWRRQTPVSKLLRQLLNKVVQHDLEKAMASVGCFYNGIEAEPLARQEEKWREQSLIGHIPKHMPNECAAISSPMCWCTPE